MAGSGRAGSGRAGLDMAGWDCRLVDGIRDDDVGVDDGGCDVGGNNDGFVAHERWKEGGTLFFLIPQQLWPDIASLPLFGAFRVEYKVVMVGVVAGGCDLGGGGGVTGSYGTGMTGGVTRGAGCCGGCQAT